MRALICREFGPWEQLSLDALDDPTPGEGEILIDVRAAGVNFPDLLIVQGKYQALPPLPFVAGAEGAGVVSELGPGVTRFETGEAVVAVGTGLIGSFAEKMVVAESMAAPVPKGMDFETAAGISITYATSYYALKQRARLAEGETLLVLGAAGGVGLAAVELGKQMGARVIAAVSSQEKLETATAAGADLGINYSEEPLKQRVKELTGGRGADVIYDPVGGYYSEQAFRAAAWEGRHLVIGFAAGDIPRLPLNLALLKGASIVGVFWGSWVEREPEASAQNFRELTEWFEKGVLRPLISTYPLDRYLEAFRALSERRARGKLVLLPG